MLRLVILAHIILHLELSVPTIVHTKPHRMEYTSSHEADHLMHEADDTSINYFRGAPLELVTAVSTILARSPTHPSPNFRQTLGTHPSHTPKTSPAPP